MDAGVSVARALAGSWREPPPDPPNIGEVAEIEEQLMQSGAAGSVWWRITRDPVLSQSPLGRRFHEAFKLNVVHAGLHRAQISKVLEALGEFGVEPILFKGWDCARMYPHAGMRPYGDIDLSIHPEEEEKARSILARIPEGTFVDLEHQEIDSASIPGLFERSRWVELDGLTVRVMGPEDRLRTLALHALKGEVWSPRSLCDVALAVESRPVEFDWQTCLTDDPVVRDWVLTAISLAGRLLGADLTGVPPRTTPRWLVRRTLEVWSEPWPAKHGVELDVLPGWSRPLALFRALGARWPGPVQATLSTHARFGATPRLYLQLTEVCRRTTRYLGRRAAS